MTSRYLVAWAGMLVLVVTACSSGGSSKSAVSTTVARSATSSPTTTITEVCPAPVPSSITQPAGVVARFDLKAHQTPEGVAVDKSGNVFVSLQLLGQVLRFAPGSGKYELFGSIPNFNMTSDLLEGLAVDAAGNVYGAASNGVWRFDCRTGKSTRLPGTEAIVNANALAFDQTGNLYVTSSDSGGANDTLPVGAVWRIGAHGGLKKWLEDTMLGGTGAFGFPTAIGANGIAYRQGTLYVNNTEKSSVLSIPIRKGGTPGPVTTVIENKFIPDGIAFDARGRIYIAHVAASEIVRVNADGTVDTIASGAKDHLDADTSIAFGTTNGTKHTLYAVNLTLNGTSAPGGGPALVAIQVDTPGMALP